MRSDLTEIQRRALVEISHCTKESKLTGKQIAGKIGLKERTSGKEGADMRSVINALRGKGFPICADGEGYYWPQTSNELSVFIASLQGRIDKQQLACDGLKKGFDKIAKRYRLESPPQSAPTSPIQQQKLL